MKKAAIRVSATLILFCGFRLAIIWFEGIKDAYWYTFLVPSAIFGLAFLEIAWTKLGFQDLEPVMLSLIDSPNEKAVIRWYRNSVRRMFRTRDCVRTALLFSPLVALGAYSVKWGSWHADSVLKWYDYAGAVCMFSAAAASQWPFSNISVFVVRLPGKKLRVNFYAHRRDNIMAIGTFMLKIVLGGMFLTFLTGMMLYVSPCKTTEVAYCLLIGVFTWAIVWFFVTQYNVHDCMVMRKRQMLDEAGRKLLTALDRSVKEPDLKNVADHQAINAIYEKVNALPEWPFKTQSVLTLFTSAIIPIGLAVLKLIFPK